MSPSKPKQRLISRFHWVVVLCPHLSLQLCPAKTSQAKHSSHSAVRVGLVVLRAMLRFAPASPTQNQNGVSSRASGALVLNHALPPAAHLSKTQRLRNNMSILPLGRKCSLIVFLKGGPRLYMCTVIFFQLCACAWWSVLCCACGRSRTDQR